MSRYAYSIPSQEDMKRYIRSFLKRHDMTVYQLGRRAGVSGSAIRVWLEGNNRSMKYDNVYQIVEYMREIG